MPRGAVGLNFKSFGSPASPPLIVLHGLFGSLDNWLPEGKSFSAQYSVHLLDLRNHGASPHSDLFDYSVLSLDLLHFLDKQKIGSAHLLGHSLGGKTVMRFAADHPDRVRTLVVVDIAPKPYPPLYRHVFQGLSSVDPALFSSRTEVGRALMPFVPHDGIRLFLLKNLAQDESGKMRWKLNVAGLQAHEADIIGWEELKTTFARPALFLRGGQSGYVQPEDEPLIKKSFPKAEIATIPEAGHWPHADTPAAFAKAVMGFLGKHT